MSAKLCLFWRLKGRIGSLSFPTSRGCSHSLACGCITLTSVYIIMSLTLTLLPPTYMDPCDYIAPIQIIQDNFLTWNFLIISANYLLMCKIMCSYVPGIEIWTLFWGGGCHYSAWYRDQTPWFILSFIVQCLASSISCFHLSMLLAHFKTVLNSPNQNYFFTEADLSKFTLILPHCIIMMHFKAYLS